MAVSAYAEPMAETYARPRFGEPREPKNRVNPGSRLVGVIEFVAASQIRALAFLIACGLVLFLPGFFNIPPIDRDEPRFAQATKQMVETGDFVDIRFQDEVRYKKPVGIYWLQAAAVEAASALGLPRAQVRIWLYRVPSLVGAIGAVLLTYWAALAFVTRRGAILAGLLLCSSVLLGVEARLAKTDAMLLLTVVAAMGAMARVYLSWQRGEDPARPPWVITRDLLDRAGGRHPAEGPADPDVHRAHDRDARDTRPVRRVALAAATGVGSDVAVDFGAAVVRRDLLAGGRHIFRGFDRRRHVKQTGSAGIPWCAAGTLPLLFWVTFWPAAPLAGIAAPAVWRARKEPGAQYLLAWLIPSWIVFELVLTKLPHYVLPLYPAIAILTVGALERRVLSRSWLRSGAAWWFVIPALASVTAIVAAIALTRQPVFLAWPFVAAALIFGLFAWWLYDDNRAERSLLNAVVAAMFLAAAIYGVIVPSMTPLFPSSEIARALRNVVCVGPKAAAAGFHEPSLVFMTGTSTLLTDGSGRGGFPRAGQLPLRRRRAALGTCICATRRGYRTAL